MNEIRLNLDDIANSNLESDVCQILNEIHKDMPIRRVIFWFNGELSDESIKKSCEFLSKRLNMCVYYTKREPSSDFAWFDIISDKKFHERMNNRFFVIYSSNKKEQILLGFSKYIEVVKFIENGNKKVMYKKNE